MYPNFSPKPPIYVVGIRVMMLALVYVKTFHTLFLEPGTSPRLMMVDLIVVASTYKGKWRTSVVNLNRAISVNLSQVRNLFISYD